MTSGIVQKIHSRDIGIFTYIAFSRSFKKEGASSSSSSESSRSKSMSRSLCLSPAAIKAQFSRGHKKITQVHVNNPSWITIHQLMYYKHDKCCYFFLLHDKHLTMSTAKHFINLSFNSPVYNHISSVALEFFSLYNSVFKYQVKKMKAINCTIFLKKQCLADWCIPCHRPLSGSFFI